MGFGEIIKSLNYTSLGGNGRHLLFDAVVVSTSPKREMDLKRADAAIDAVRETYGELRSYKGLWIAAGRLNEPNIYEGSQRQGIVKRLEKAGVMEVQQIDGEDTVDKVRELGKIYGIEQGLIQRIAVASYPLHIARFNLALAYAQKEGLIDPRVEILGIETPYDAFFLDTKPLRLGDGVTGILGLIKDARRLDRHGFRGAVPGQASEFHKKVRSFNSEDRDKDRQ